MYIRSFNPRRHQKQSVTPKPFDPPPPLSTRPETSNQAALPVKKRVLFIQPKERQRIQPASPSYWLEKPTTRNVHPHKIANLTLLGYPPSQILFDSHQCGQKREK